MVQLCDCGSHFCENSWIVRKSHEKPHLVPPLVHPVPVGSGAAVHIIPLSMVPAHALVGMLDLALYVAEPDLACRPAAWRWTCLVAEPGHCHCTCSALLVWVPWDWAPCLWGPCPCLPQVTVSSQLAFPCGAARFCHYFTLLQLLLYNCFAPQKLKPKEHHGIHKLQTWQNQKICKVKKKDSLERVVWRMFHEYKLTSLTVIFIWKRGIWTIVHYYILWKKEYF